MTEDVSIELAIVAAAVRRDLDTVTDIIRNIPDFTTYHKIMFGLTAAACHLNGMDEGYEWALETNIEQPDTDSARAMTMACQMMTAYANKDLDMVSDFICATGGDETGRMAGHLISGLLRLVRVGAAS